VLYHLFAGELRNKKLASLKDLYTRRMKTTIVVLAVLSVALLASAADKEKGSLQVRHRKATQGGSTVQ
jgi:hypothetical protein